MKERELSSAELNRFPGGNLSAQEHSLGKLAYDGITAVLKSSKWRLRRPDITTARRCYDEI